MLSFCFSSPSLAVRIKLRQSMSPQNLHIVVLLGSFVVVKKAKKKKRAYLFQTSVSKFFRKLSDLLLQVVGSLLFVFLCKCSQTTTIPIPQLVCRCFSFVWQACLHFLVSPRQLWESFCLQSILRSTVSRQQSYLQLACQCGASVMVVAR